ncbi:pachytene checkpoint protein 2 homolog [Ischnura elegans]|uniref:pachytene checkpoint protein 2 homolog n=1 Tax=Ischnura elegans TaxID=197161 RepID=UPI001ED87A26|nr:pachytene checkpoint protein 2 homolog [Ischnura elegans]
MKFPLHIEIIQRQDSSLTRESLRSYIKKIVEDEGFITPGVTLTNLNSQFLEEHVQAINISDLPCDHEKERVSVSEVIVKYYVYRLDNAGPQAEVMEADDDITAANHWILPSSDFHGLWESLVYDSSIKDNLLNFVETTLLFSDKEVDTNIVSWNRVVLLHGPPGTGKTSLCKALAQKLSIRLSERYRHGQLVEINSHSLFSKWFSESGKLVMKMFEKIRDLIDDKEALVCVLLDEVESLAHARKASMSVSEPSDSLRVVNAVLTQIDQMRRYPNVLVLTTSNLTNAIDLAFVDRADIKQYIGLPSSLAIYKIYHSCINELLRVGIITSHEKLFPMRSLQLAKFEENDATRLSIQLLNIARASEGMSGRTLRKIPFLAHAHFIQSPVVTLEDFLKALEKAVVKQKLDCEEFDRGDT